jgi:hypothetical protein
MLHKRAIQWKWEEFAHFRFALDQLQAIEALFL